MAVTWRGGGDLHMDAPAAALPCLEIKSLETTVVELPAKCTSQSPSPSPSQLLPKMDIPKVKRIDPPSTTTTADSPPTSSEPRRGSRPTSANESAHHSRSNSRSTARSRPPSRHGSLHSSRRAVTSTSIVTVPSTRPSPHERRESLLALHRDSCRLFQEINASTTPAEDVRSVPALSRSPSSTYTSRREGRTSSETGGSAPPSPVTSSQSSRRFDFEHRNSISSIMTPLPPQARDRSNTLPNKTPEYDCVQSPSASSVHVPETVTEWTSPSSRRAEYEKIDRAGRGVRGLWRRVAPRWCQAQDARTPFFKEGNTSREGSVRRFRMDLPDEELDNTVINPHEKPEVQILDFLGKGIENGSRRWTYRRTKTSPA
ncbi:hypothetical protein N7509_009563 [Penicillium cosmopolitanum]|uniref:Uncharacterized protein n=1 Tax=Penicillium cosmopolitanum TaxID=1131564 RepID=A0A9X0B3S5_9EURO|nr:uncharacterized protein N7509_009563 [Penicillium cosmopolitanum]KAJ5387022.1 hypothetical protein N7509_009563 [Penicillium cosmopolitanum]